MAVFFCPTLRLWFLERSPRAESRIVLPYGWRGSKSLKGSLRFNISFLLLLLLWMLGSTHATRVSPSCSSGGCYEGAHGQRRQRGGGGGGEVPNSADTVIVTPTSGGGWIMRPGTPGANPPTPQGASGRPPALSASGARAGPTYRQVTVGGATRGGGAADGLTQGQGTPG